MFRAFSIWHLDHDDTVTIRSGPIVIDSDDMPIDAQDAERAIHVADGLQPRDIAVFADIIGNERLYENPVGFVVGAANPDGSGIIVHGSKVSKSPRDWASEHTLQLWSYLEEIEPTIFEEFGLSALKAYIHSSSRTR